MAQILQTLLKNEKFGDLVWSSDVYNCFVFNGSYYMYRNEFFLGSIFKPIEQTKYKTYEKWIEFLRAKDIKKICECRERVKKLLKECEMLENIWN